MQAISGEYELAEVVQSYERRLEEQVTLAKIDIISALEHQIQVAELLRVIIFLIQNCVFLFIKRY